MSHEILMRMAQPSTGRDTAGLRRGAAQLDFALAAL